MPTERQFTEVIFSVDPASADAKQLLSATGYKKISKNIKKGLEILLKMRYYN